MHLHAFLDGQTGRLARLGLGNRDHQLGFLAARVEQLLRLDHRGAGDFQFGIEVRGAVLQGLEFADQLAELLALLEVGGGHVERAKRHADAFRRRTDAAGVEHAVQHFTPAIDFANHGIGIQLYPVELHMGALRAVDQADHVQAQTSGILGHGEQGDPVVVVIAASGAGRDDQQVGAAALDDKGLRAAQLEAVASAFGAGGNALGTVLRTFVDRHGEHAVT